MLSNNVSWGMLSAPWRSLCIWRARAGGGKVVGWLGMSGALGVEDATRPLTRVGWRRRDARSWL